MVKEEEEKRVKLEDIANKLINENTALEKKMLLTGQLTLNEIVI